MSTDSETREGAVLKLASLLRRRKKRKTPLSASLGKPAITKKWKFTTLAKCEMAEVQGKTIVGNLHLVARKRLRKKRLKSKGKPMVADTLDHPLFE